METRLALLLLALGVDRFVGDPDWLWRRLPHPVVVFGRMVGLCEARLNRETDTVAVRRAKGGLAIVLLIGGAVALGLVVGALLRGLGMVGAVLETAVIAVFLAHKSLADHVGRVAAALRIGGAEAGRQAVAQIVGRDPESLDEAGICRAAIESLAENLSDGVVAPAFWYAVFGLPGLFAYKMLNTADSMIGHLSPRHRDFGRAAARLDDAANWPAARLSAMLIALAARWRHGADAGRRALATVRREASLHRSPNAGWPEAAMAGALDIRLAGPRVYGGEPVAEPFLNAAGGSIIGAATIDAALDLFAAAGTALAGLVLVLLLLTGTS